MRDYDFVDAAVLALMAAAAFFFIAAGAAACHHEFAGAATVDEAFAEVSDRMQARSVDGDESVRWDCLADFHATRAEQAAQEQREAEQAAQEAYYEPYYEEAYYEPAYYGGYSNDFMQQGVVYGEDGTRYTWYSSNAAYHYRTPEWTADEDGFYRDADGYYVVASEDYAQGDVVDTPWGEGKVYDSGCDSGTVDMYVDWS